MKQFIIATTFFFSLPFFVYAANIDATNKYARFLNTGTLINFGATNGNVVVSDTKITGYAWGANVGWINLAPTNSGVVNDGHGVLSGYAWGENTGWINFKPTNGGVTIDSSGNFSGYAWSETKGWIVFNCATDSSCGTLSHKVQTSWTPSSTTSSTATVSGGGGIPSLIGVINNSQVPPVVVPTNEQPQTTIPVEQPTQSTLPSTGGSAPVVQPSETSGQGTSAQPGGSSVPSPSQPSGQLSENQNETSVPQKISSDSTTSSFQNFVYTQATKLSDAIGRFYSSTVNAAKGSFWSVSNILNTQKVAGVSVKGIVFTGAIAALVLVALSFFRKIIVSKIITPTLSQKFSSIWAKLIAMIAALRRRSKKSIEVLPNNDAPVMPQYIGPTSSSAQEQKTKEESITENVAVPKPVDPAPESPAVDQVKKETPQPAVIVAASSSEIGIKNVPVTEPDPAPVTSYIEPRKETVEPTPSIVENQVSASVVTAPALDLEIDHKESLKVESDPAPVTSYIEPRKEITAEKPSIVESPAVVGLAVPAPTPEIVAIPKEVPVAPVAQSVPILARIKKLFEKKNIPSPDKNTCKETKFKRISRRFLNSLPKLHGKSNHLVVTGKHFWNPRPPCGKD